MSFYVLNSEIKAAIICLQIDHVFDHLQLADLLKQLFCSVKHSSICFYPRSVFCFIHPPTIHPSPRQLPAVEVTPKLWSRKKNIFLFLTWMSSLPPPPPPRPCSRKVSTLVSSRDTPQKVFEGDCQWLVFKAVWRRSTWTVFSAHCWRQRLFSTQSWGAGFPGLVFFNLFSMCHSDVYIFFLK